MKLFKRISILLAAFLILFFVGMSVYVNFYGKSFIEETLKNSLNRDVVVKKVSYYFPLSLRVQDIHISHLVEGKKFFEAEDIIAHLSVSTIFQRQLVFSSVKLIEPVLMIEKGVGLSDDSNQPERQTSSDQSDSAAEENVSDVDSNQNKNKQTKISIKHFVFKRGRLEYTNNSMDRDFSFAIEDAYLKVDYLAFPAQEGKTDFNISGRLMKEGNPLSGSSVKGHGWADIVQGDMEAKFEVIEADGSVGMTAEAVSKDNDMVVKGEIKFQNILTGGSKDDSSDTSPVNDLISSALSSAGVEISAKFSFKTKMDDFRPEQLSFSGNVVTR